MRSGGGPSRGFLKARDSYRLGRTWRDLPEPRLQLLEGKLESARALWLHEFGRYLQFASVFVNRDPSANRDVQTVFWTKPQQLR